jgi:hypothetical protein
MTMNRFATLLSLLTLLVSLGMPRWAQACPA